MTFTHSTSNVHTLITLYSELQALVSTVHLTETVIYREIVGVGPT